MQKINYIIKGIVVLALSSCANRQFLSREIKVVDYLNRPIEGVGTYPQPFVRGEKESNVDGKLKVYGAGENSIFKLIGMGYKPRDFKFNDPSSTFHLTEE